LSGFQPVFCDDWLLRDEHGLQEWRRRGRTGPADVDI